MEGGRTVVEDQEIRTLDDDERLADVWYVAVAEMLAHNDPFAAWHQDPVTSAEVMTAVDEDRVDARPFNGRLTGLDDEREYHVERIAWMYTHRDRTPVEIDVGLPSLGYHPRSGAYDFTDGNHRLCAAAMRGDELIAVAYGGEESAFHAIFPKAVRAGWIDGGGSFIEIG